MKERMRSADPICAFGTGSVDEILSFKGGDWVAMRPLNFLIFFLVAHHSMT